MDAKKFLDCINERYKRNVKSDLIVLDSASESTKYSDTAIPFAKGSDFFKKREETPKKIYEMINMYSYDEYPWYQKSKNFYKQGKFMEDYEDNYYEKVRDYCGYFVTYHELNANQLRSYFTWRTDIRKGNYRSTYTSFIYLYIYELLCKIGTVSKYDTINKLKELEENVLNLEGIENAAQIKRNLNRWYFEYSVINGFSADEIKEYIGGDAFKWDEAIEIFKKPENHSDNEIFDALVFLLGSRVAGSLSVKKQKENMIYIFAYVWKAILKSGSIDGQTVFTHCFGRLQSKRWYPLGNTPYLKESSEGTDYVLNSVRSYHYSKQVWKEKSYSKECFDRKKLTSVFREIDRYMRAEYKLGYYLKEREEDKWIRDYVKEAFDKAVLELNKTKKQQIDIDFFALNKIRSDADITRESLIVEESEDTIFDISDMTDSVKTQEEEIVKPDVPTDMDINIRILECILAGEDYKHYIKENNLFASIVTDTINERFFDDIGDNILECDGEDIYLIEDYKEDVLDIMERL